MRWGGGLHLSSSPLTPATATARSLTEVLAGGTDLMAAKGRKGSNVTTPPHPTSRR